MHDLITKKIEYDSVFTSFVGNEVYDGDIKSFKGGVSYAGRSILGTEEAGGRIYDLICDKNPCMITRFGGNELDATIRGLTEKYPILNPYRWYRKNQYYWGMFYGAGFFPKNANLIPRFAEKMYEACKQADLIGCWYNKYEDFLIENACPDTTQLCRLRALEPWTAEKRPWTEALSGRNVLVVHPFAETMKEQYKKRENLFGERKLLPEININFMKAVQTGAGAKDRRFKNWFQAYDYMLSEIEKKTEDIVILGCGAYGLPLAADLKMAGKKSIHLGGVTQLLFGIMGGRWDNDPLVKPYVNECWVRPSDSEKPPKFGYIERGCYW